jgi:adenylate cyclase
LPKTVTPAELTKLLDDNPPDLADRLVAMMEYRAVLVLDMSGFSALMRDEGIVSALKTVRGFQVFATNCIHGYDGEVVKYYADNVLALFPDIESANNAAAVAVALGDASAGIAAGYVLRLDGDVFGNAVNIASRLGEDTAKAGEVLIERASRG